MLKSLALGQIKFLLLSGLFLLSFAATAQNDELSFDEINKETSSTKNDIPSSDEIKNSTAGFSDGYITVENGSAGIIAVEKMYDASLPYKLRRTENGVLFSVGLEKFYPFDYISQFKDLAIEGILDKQRISLLNIEIGYKKNLALGSIAFLLGYSNGKIKAAVPNVNRQLEFTRQALSVNYAVDNFFKEPWIVPYIQGGIHSFDVIESKDPITGFVSKSASTGLNYNYRLGLLFQLNWIEKAIDPTTQAEGLRSSGLENAFIDVYAVDHTSLGEHYDVNTVGDQGKPNLTSNFDLGVGLKLEF